MNGCFNCAHLNSEKCKTCRTNIGELWEHEVKTNADKIRSMTDEELADLLTADCKYIPEELCRKYLGNCDACLREWLKQKIVKE